MFPDFKKRVMKMIKTCTDDKFKTNIYLYITLYNVLYSVKIFYCYCYSTVIKYTEMAKCILSQNYVRKRFRL